MGAPQWSRGFPGLCWSRRQSPAWRRAARPLLILPAARPVKSGFNVPAPAGGGLPDTEVPMPKPNRRAVEARAERDGWLDHDGRRTMLCELCSRPRVVSQIREVATTQPELLAREANVMYVCGRCERYMHTLGRLTS